MFNTKDYAFQIQVTLNSIFKREEYRMGGISDIDSIERQPFIAIVLILGNFYNGAEPGFKNKIDDFFSIYSGEMKKSITEIGEDRIKNILEDLKKIVSTI